MCYGLLNRVYICSIPFDDKIGMYYAGWELVVRRSTRPVLELADSVGMLVTVTISAAFFADFCRDWEGKTVEDCNRHMHSDVGGSKRNFLRGG